MANVGTSSSGFGDRRGGDDGASGHPQGRRKVASVSRSGRVALKIQQKIDEGRFYEAHQMCRALFRRYTAQGREEEAMDLLYHAAVHFLRHEQWESGNDLGLLMLDHLKENKMPVSQSLLERISNLFELFHTGDKQLLESKGGGGGGGGGFDCPVKSPPVYETFMRAALKWTSIVEPDESKYGHPSLHWLLAMAYWRESNYPRARDHFLYASQAEECGRMLVEVATSVGYRGEGDLFIAQMVLQLLVLQRRGYAMKVFLVYTESHPNFKDQSPPFNGFPLLNFLWFLILASKFDENTATFECLRKEYSRVLNRDPTFYEYLSKIGCLFFGVVSCTDHSVGGGSGPGDFLGQLFGGGGGGGEMGGEGGGGLLGLLSGIAGPPPPFPSAPGPTPPLLLPPPSPHVVDEVD